MAWVGYFPLGSAFGGAAKVTEHPAVLAAAAAQGATTAQVGLAWLLAHDPHILLIPGTSNLQHLDENVATTNILLDDATMVVLDDLAAAAGPPCPFRHSRNSARHLATPPGCGIRSSSGRC